MQLTSKNVWTLFAILSLWSTSACTPKIPDVPACENLSEHLVTELTTGHLILVPSPACMKAIGERTCGHCVYIISGREVFVGEQEAHHLNKKPWSKLKNESVYLPAEEAYAPLATYIINACKKMGCNKDVERFRVRLGNLKSIQK